jgi:septum formation protein
MSHDPIILASSSPRRRRLLAEAGIEHEVVVPAADEAPLPGEPPGAYAVRCARAKAHDVAGRFPRRLVLAADTVVVLAGEILGKPGSPERTVAFLAQLSGATHEVLTGVALVRQDPLFVREAMVRSRVTFRRLTPEEIDRYAASGEGNDKAGGYGIQSAGRDLVTSYTGSFTNIVGLPMEVVRELLAEVEIGHA